MNKRHSIHCGLLLAMLPMVAACGVQAPSAADEVSTELANAAAELRAASTELEQELAHGDISLSSDDSSAPDAVITPEGALVIDGREVQTDPAQRALLLEYRRQVGTIAKAGADIGMQGAGLAMKAMGEVAKGIFNGAGEADIERSIEAEVATIKAGALEICDQIPALLQTQQELATAVPEFAPYATADVADVDACREGLAAK